MKKSELLNLFKEYLDNELKQIVKEAVIRELKEHSKKSSSFVNNNSSSFSELMEDIDLIGVHKKKQPVKKKIELFKSNNPLSQLLNETAEESMAQQYEDDDADDEMPVFDRRLFTSKAVLEKERMSRNNNSSPDFEEMTQEEINAKKQLRDKYMGVIGENMISNSPGGGGASSAQEMIPEDRKGIIIPAELETALTKDYSQLVKKFKKK